MMADVEDKDDYLRNTVRSMTISLGPLWKAWAWEVLNLYQGSNENNGDVLAVEKKPYTRTY
jgi:hypothetical protein